MNDDFDFTGKVVLITGSSRGIGAAIIQALGQRGAQCAVNYVADAAGRNQADAERVARGLANAIVFQCDVGDEAQVGAMMAEVQKQFGGLDILVNNAGILRDRSLQKMSTEEWESVLRVNLTGSFNCLHHAAGLMRNGGSVVNISSVSGQVGFFGQYFIFIDNVIEDKGFGHDQNKRHQRTEPGNFCHRHGQQIVQRHGMGHR
jgi:3-oxoacyl-[acyl-carrier protein] reductase